jgi:hypothetical protein
MYVLIVLGVRGLPYNNGDNCSFMIEGLKELDIRSNYPPGV